MSFYSESIFPFFFDSVVRNKVFDQRRKAVLSNCQGKVLEIGAGTGINLDYYPDFIEEITVVEPNPGMKIQFQKKALAHRIKVDFRLSGAEKMPFPDQTFDTVVSTITMCSIPDLQGALAEIKRVLKPEGIFIFLDHGLSDENFTARVQRFLNPLHSCIGAGCQLNKNYEIELHTANFQILELKKYNIKNAPKFIGFVYEGIAKVRRTLSGV